MATNFALIAVIVGCFFSASLGAVLEGPKNDAALAGSNITIECTSTSLGTERIQFLEYNTNPNGALISDGATLLPGHPNYFRHTLVTDVNAGTYTLTIRDTVLADGGKYACRDVNTVPLLPQYSDLVIIEANPNCTTTLPESRFINVGQYFTVECVVNYRSSPGINPFIFWRGAGDFAQATTSTNTSTWGAMAFTTQRAQDGTAFFGTTNFTQAGFGGVDTANNIPTWQYTYTTGLLFVQYGPTNVSYAPVLPSYEVGQILTCYADSSPLPSYTWTNLLTLVDYRSQSLTLTTDFVGTAVLRCQVVNSVSTANIFTNITVNPITTPTTPTTTTPAPTVPAIAPCDDLTGRWEYDREDGSQAVLCINVDKSQNGLVRGLFWNDTVNEPIFTEIIGRTRNDEFDEIGFSTMWATRIGVSSFAGECHKCRGEEILLLNAVSRSSADQAFCAEGGTVIVSPQYRLYRKPITFPCSANVAAMEETVRARQPARRRRRMVLPPVV